MVHTGLGGIPQDPQHRPLGARSCPGRAGGWMGGGGGGGGKMRGWRTEARWWLGGWVSSSSNVALRPQKP